MARRILVSSSFVATAYAWSHGLTRRNSCLNRDAAFHRAADGSQRAVAAKAQRTLALGRDLDLRLGDVVGGVQSKDIEVAVCDSLPARRHNKNLGRGYLMGNDCGRSDASEALDDL
jgi:hypothetical protein